MRQVDVSRRSDRGRPGRPRAIPADYAVDTREQILAAAAELFTAQGFAATGTREIAAQAGLRQASLFHYFPHKDDLLAELLDRTVMPALAAAAWLDSAAAEPAVRLYVLARQDARNLCSGPPNLGVLQLMPEARRERFADFWAKRALLRDRYEALIAEAAKAGKLLDAPVETLTNLVFGAVEATMTWYRADADLGPDEAAEAVASTAVRGILVRPPTPGGLRRAGDRLLAKRDAQHC
jgi:AcrR family transcriptional regulator